MWCGGVIPPARAGRPRMGATPAARPRGPQYRGGSFSQPTRRSACSATRTAAGRASVDFGRAFVAESADHETPTGFADKIVNITGQPDDIVHAVAQIVGRLRNWQGVAHHDPAVFVALAPPSVVAAIAHERPDQRE